MGTHLRFSFYHSLMNFEKPKKSDLWKNEENCWRYHHFTYVYKKPQSCETHFQRHEVRQNFLSFWDIFSRYFPLPLPPNNPEKQNFEKNFKTIKKRTWRHHHFKQLHLKSWSYAILFLRYGMCWMQLLFFILGNFLSFFISKTSSGVRNIKNGPCRESKIMAIFEEKLQSYKFKTSFYISNAELKLPFKLYVKDHFC